MNIRTEYVFPPIPDRSFDCCAVDDDTYDGEGSPIGFGSTKEKAVEDLMEILKERGLVLPTEPVPPPSSTPQPKRLPFAKDYEEIESLEAAQAAQEERWK